LSVCGGNITNSVGITQAPGQRFPSEG